MAVNMLNQETVLLDLDGIKERIPHRKPILRINRISVIDDVVCGVYIPSDDVFEGHFPGHPIHPGFILEEVVAQATLAMIAISDNEEIADFVSIKMVFLSEGRIKFLQRGVLPEDIVLIKNDWYEIHTPDLRKPARKQIKGMAKVSVMGIEIANIWIDGLMVFSKNYLNP